LLSVWYLIVLLRFEVENFFLQRTIQASVPELYSQCNQQNPSKLQDLIFFYGNAYKKKKKERKGKEKLTERKNKSVKAALLGFFHPPPPPPKQLCTRMPITGQCEG